MKFLRFLKSELSVEAQRWISDGLVSKEQASQILSRYGSSLDYSKKRSPGTFVLSALAIFLFGLALILVISKNWDEIPRAVRMGSLLLLTLSVNGYGVWLYEKGREAGAKLAFFFGSISYGCSIFLIAQIYHLGADFPDGILLWALGVLPFLFLLDGVLLALLFLVLSCLWAIVESSVGHFPWLFPLFAGATLWFATKKQYSLMLFLGVLGASIMWIEELIRHFFSMNQSYGSEHIYLTATIFVLLFGIGKLIARSTDVSPVHEYGLATQLWSIRILLFGMVVFSFDSIWKELIRSSVGLTPFILVCNGVLIAGAIAVYFSAMHRDGNGKFPVTTFAPLFGMVGFVVLSSLLIISTTAPFAPEVLGSGVRYSSELREVAGGTSIILMLLSNFTLLLSGIWMIYRGFDSGSGAYFYSGVGVIVLTALIRYFDLVGGYLGSALILTIAAGILYGSSRMWRQHIKNHQQSEVQA